MLINILFYGSAIIIVNVSCHPHSKLWDPTIPGTCIDRKAVDVSAASLNLASHTLILILPQSVIWKLRMSTKKKISVSLVFAIGILAFVSGILRLLATIQYFKTSDVTYAISSMALWALAEATFVILVFCAPSIPIVVRESTLLSTICKSLYSRTSSSLRPMNGDSREKRATSNHILPSPGNTYRKIDENFIPLGNLRAQEPSMSGTATQPTRHNIAYPIDSFDTPIQPDGIIRTIEIDTSEEHRHAASTVNGNTFKATWDSHFP
ncbi:hypothetical protein GGR54DRAFT_636129 [Hypoxylon sp. NC1633]|nr:hypothetical protein GGR54DRAFT_636129 [Hypoxylon sp. NC1633]